jgi:hypothetical protein
MSDSAREASTAYAIERVSNILLKHYEKIVVEAKPRKGNWSVRLRKLLESFAE